MSPNSSFKVITRIYSDSEVNYKGNQATMAKLKYSGIKIPMIIHSYRTGGESVKTGSLRSDSSFEVIMHFDYDSSLTIRNGDTVKTPTESLAGMKIASVYTKDNKLIGIQVLNGKLPDDLKQVLAKTIEDLYKKIKFPVKPMNIGDSFKQTIPVKIPLGSAPPIEMKMKVEYKLMKVEGYKAYFNTIYKMTLNDSLETLKINLTGNGTGKLIHDLQKNFAIENNSEMKMKEIITTKEIETIVTSTSKSYFKVLE